MTGFAELPWLSILLFGGGILAGALALFVAWQPKLARLRERLAVAESRVAAQQEIVAEREQALALAEERLGRAFESLARRSLQDNSRDFLQLAGQKLEVQHSKAESELKAREQAVEAMVKPISDALKRTEEQIARIEKDRNESFGNLRGLLESMSRSQQTLSAETRNLVTALRRPEVRGQWGEMTLRRLVELAGMVEHCDFTEQHHLASEDGALRPDMVIHLAEGRQLVVDVKTPLDAYLAAVEAPDDATRDAALQRHARKVRERVRELAAKSYWSQFENSPEFVVLFIPGDQFLSAALAQDPTLLDDALNQHVILATPTSLVALLKAVAYGWRQVALAENAREVRDLASDLYRRLATFTGHLARLGKTLSSSVEAYNSAVGSLERQVLPGARKFTELGVQARKQLEPLPELDVMARRTSAESAPASETDAAGAEADDIRASTDSDTHTHTDTDTDTDDKTA